MKKIDNSTVGGRIKEQRLKRGMTQEQLAEQLFIKKVLYLVMKIIV
ncbi:MAG: helix-turn-helix transcriptional regulator [Lachnospiraceae bacterium]